MFEKRLLGGGDFAAQLALVAEHVGEVDRLYMVADIALGLVLEDGTELAVMPIAIFDHIAEEVGRCRN